MIGFAWTVLFSWPVVAAVLFRRYSLPIAICVTIIGGYLILPNGVGIDLPALPSLNKNSIPVLSAFVLTIVALSRPRQSVAALPGWLPRDRVSLWLIGILCVGPIGTTLVNGDPVYIGWRTLKGLEIYDGASMLLQALMILLPFLLARRVLGSRDGQWVLIMTFAVSGLIYSFLALWEVRMSPQLHTQVYGIQAFSFIQQVRQGGFRPVVFLSHGLSLGIFLSLAILASAGLFRLMKAEAKTKWRMVVVWLVMTLILSKSIGALLIALVLLPVALMCKPRTQILVAAAIATLVLLYPAARAANLVPVDRVLAAASSISAERAQSLEVRLVNEDQLLARARERPLFGWGDWGRNRVYDASGQNISISDGAWVIIFGVGGWFRYIGAFGLLCWPIIAMALQGRRRIDAVGALLALILSAKLLDLIPNSGLDPFVFLMAGSLLGRVETAAARLGATKEPTPGGVSHSLPVLARSRFAPAAAAEPDVPFRQADRVIPRPRPPAKDTPEPVAAPDADAPRYARPKAPQRYRRK